MQLLVLPGISRRLFYMDGRIALLCNYKTGKIKENASGTTITEKTSIAYYRCQVCHFQNLLDPFFVTFKKAIH